jgi:hypothetical protein
MKAPSLRSSSSVRLSQPASDQIIRAARRLRRAVARLVFAPPVTCVYNPLTYAWGVHQAYLAQFGCGVKRVLFLGMNPGRFGMLQTGVPFGEVAAVRDWLKLKATAGRPLREHPRRKAASGADSASQSGQSGGQLELGSRRDPPTARLGRLAV